MCVESDHTVTRNTDQKGFTVNYPIYPRSMPALDRRYSDIVEFIALNDEPTVSDLDEIQYQISTICASVAFDWPAELIARDVYDERKRCGII